MELQEIKQSAIESIQKKIGRGEDTIADMKLDIQRKKEETKELEQEIVAHENLIKFREKAISKIKEID
tara:strand:+ start:239 stop:442 length:204 start_codon:yes stop_codon:yes gene_type:complete